MNNLLKLKFRYLGYIIIAWVIFGFILSVHEYLFLGNFPGIFESEFLNEYGFINNTITSVAISFLGAVCIGSLEEFYFRSKLKKYSFGNIILIKTLIYSVIVAGLTVIGSLIFNSIALDQNIFSSQVLKNTLEYMNSGGFWNTNLVFFFGILFTNIILQINNRFGPGVLGKMVRGYYHNPKEEERTFMFLDIKSSTSIAEEMGHVKYFRMLNDFFADIADPIIENFGEIYQYVGDEVVVSWRKKNYQYIYQCYLHIVQKIDSRESHYIKEYGILPKFKAGLHCGWVTVGEVGAIKREVVFSGDVLNTAARIQGVCNRFNTDFLISDNLYQELDNKSDFVSVGDIALKGKNDTIQLYSRR